MEKAFGVDVSAYQEKTDWDVVAAHQPKVIFAGIRAAVSWGYQDAWFPRNWQEAKRVGILRMAYHVVFPSEDATRQVDNLMKMLGQDIGELPPVLDCELDQGQSPEHISNVILSMARLIEARTGKRPIIYSRALWVNEFMAGATWLDSYDWWLAQYLFTPDEHPGPPMLPTGVSKWLIHQTTSQGPPIGISGQVMDYDRWNGSEADVFAFAGKTPQPQTLKQRVERLEVEARAHGWNI